MLDTLQVHLTNENVKTIGDYIKDYSFLITLIVGAFLGFILNRIYEGINFGEKRRFFFHALFELSNALEHQITLYEDYIENLNSGKDHLNSLYNNVGFNLRNIDLVSREIIYKIFVVKSLKEDKEHLRRLTVLMNGFNLIQHQNDIDETQDSKIREVNDNYKLQYSEARKNLLKDIDVFINSNTDVTDPGFITFVETYNQLTRTYYSNLNDDNKSVFYDRDNFLLPLFDMVKHVEYDDLIHQISAMLHTVSQVEVNRLEAVKKVTNETKQLEDVLHDFLDTLRIYKEFLTLELPNKFKPITKSQTNMDNQDQAYKEAEEKRQLLKKELEKEANDRKHESQSIYDKYMISLSTASLGFSVAFIKESDFIGKNYKWVIVVSWVFFVISTIITLISFRTSISAYKKQLDDINNIFEGKTLSETMHSSNKYTKFFNKINIYTFIIGIILTFVYIYINL